MFIIAICSRLARDRELERKIREHMQHMAEKRRQPKASPQEEMAAAKRDLELVSQQSPPWF